MATKPIHSTAEREREIGRGRERGGEREREKERESERERGEGEGEREGERESERGRERGSPKERKFVMCVKKSMSLHALLLTFSVCV